MSAMAISKPLKRLAEINRAVLPESTDPDFEIEYVDISNVSGSGQIIGTETLLFGNAPSRARRVVRSGDTIVSTVRTYLKAITSIQNPPPNLVVSTGFATLTPGPELDGHYFAFFAQSERFIHEVVSRSSGVSYPAITPTELGNIHVIVPPLPVQRRIAAYLDLETARIDALVAEKETLLKLLEEKRASLISQAVTRGLDPKAKLKPSGIPWLGDVPENWEVKELRYLVDPKRQVMYGIVLPGAHVENGVPIIKGGDVRPHRLNPDTLSRTTHEIAASHSRSMVRSGDILFSIRGSIGDVALVPESLDGANITQDAARIAPRSGVDRDWLFWALQSDYAYSSLEIGSLGAAVRGINIRDLKRLWLAVPTPHEQRAIGTFLTKQMENSIGLEADMRSSIVLLREKRVSLISSAVTGEMVPLQ